MSEVNHYTLMAEYNEWMNRRLYELCAQIPDEIRKQDLGAFFKSIHATLNHLLFGDLVWMGRFTGNPCSFKIGEEIYRDFSELRSAREEKDKEIIEWVKTLDETWLLSPLHWTSISDGKKRVVPHWKVLSHMFNHQTHHRGQLTTLLSQQGYEPGVTDIPFMPGVCTEQLN